MKKRLITTLTIIALSSSLISGIPVMAADNANTYTTVKAESILTEKDVNTNITLGDEIVVAGNGADVTDNTVTITSAGTYNISGTLKDGQIIVNSKDSDSVRILLNGVNISSSTSSAIYVKKGNTVLTLASNTVNTISDASSYVYEDETADEPDAAIFSKADLIINGNGTLNVSGNYNTGIRSKDSLSIEGGNITVTSVDDGIKGKDSVTILDGNINITSGNDGIKSTSTKESKGYVRIDGGTITINSQTDGIQAESTLTINGGDINILSGNGSEYGKEHVEDNMPAPPAGDGQGGMNPPPDGFRPGDGTAPPDGNFKPENGENPPSMIPNGNVPAEKPDSSSNNSNTDTSTDDSTSVSSKGLKAEGEISINGGTLNINSADDAVHANGNVTVNGGKITLETGDDALHADNTLEINSGNINITKSYEGLEATYITINDGTVYVKSSDDGMNASVKVTESTEDETSTVKNIGEADTSNSTAVLKINGGYIVVDAEGDGLDANGSIYITGGTTIVNGPVADNNGALDYDVTMEISGGTLIAAGSLGMAETPSESSTQNSISVSVSTQNAGTLLHIESEDGEDIITFAPSKQYGSVIVSSPKIKTGETYKAYYGGSSTGTPTDGLYKNGIYSSGTEAGSITVEGSVSKITEDGVTVGRPGMGGPGGNGQMPPSSTDKEESDSNKDNEESTPDKDNEDVTPDDNVSVDESSVKNEENSKDSSSSDKNYYNSTSTKTGDSSKLSLYGITLILSSIGTFLGFKKKQIKQDLTN